ncbi:hypothetical protein GCM10020358_38080 [Amorphoplanes nipponensis]|uniref:S-adenosyl methyltransferase n=1 Tax=Actinoplanes nipponensis TaxID=135950 RepID=A0A919MPC9_9ACTN|nr:SAM-dependent methyltransferase [Actinoplanes nipponensis]GIE52476.1 hypothetical protein Ani05nite_60100 [Actinoplanes nipponensis]
MRDYLGNWRAGWAGDARPGAEDMDQPALYRVRDHALGGMHSLETDRIHWQVFTDAYPMIETIVRETVAFRVRAVDHLTGLGVRQFVEIGSWLPTMWPTHTLAPQARVVYAADDRAAVLYGERKLRSEPTAIMIHGDPSDPGTILDGEAAQFLDLAEPCAVLPGVLDLMDDPAAPWWVVAQIAASLAPDSWMVATHLTPPRNGEDRNAQDLLCTLWKTLGVGLYPRPADELRDWFSAVSELAAPICPAEWWWPDPDDTPPDSPTCPELLGITARVPATGRTAVPTSHFHDSEPCHREESHHA